MGVGELMFDGQFLERCSGPFPLDLRRAIIVLIAFSAVIFAPDPALLDLWENDS